MERIIRYGKGLDLRFGGSEEALFRRSLKGDLRKMQLYLSAVFAIIECVTVLPEMLAQTRRLDDKFAWGSQDPRTVMFAVHVGLEVSSICAFAMAALVHVTGRLKWVDCEFQSTALCVQAMLSVMFANKWSLSATHGLRAAEVWGYGGQSVEAEVTGILYVLGTVVLFCLIVPVRTHILWVVPLLGAVVYPLFCSFTESNMKAAVPRFSLLIMFVCAFSHVGARRHEAQMRMRWRAVSNAAERESMAKGLEQVSWLSCEVTLALDTQGRVLESSAKQDSFFGQSMCGQSLTEVVREDDREPFLAALERASAISEVQSLPVTFELPHAVVKSQLAVVAIFGPITHLLIGIGQVEHEHLTPLGPTLQAIEEDVEFNHRAASNRHGCDVTSIITSCVTERVFKDINRLCAKMAANEDTAASVRRRLKEVAHIGVKEHWLIGTEELNILDPPVILGKGGVFGCVTVALHNGVPVAIKVPLKGTIPNSASTISALCNEIRLLHVLLSASTTNSQPRLAVVEPF